MVGRRSGELGRGGGGGGSKVHHFEDVRRCVEVINLSDPRVAEFETLKKNKICERNMLNIFGKK